MFYYSQWNMIKMSATEDDESVPKFSEIPESTILDKVLKGLFTISIVGIIMVIASIIFNLAISETFQIVSISILLVGFLPLDPIIGKIKRRNREETKKFLNEIRAYNDYLKRHPIIESYEDNFD